MPKIKTRYPKTVAFRTSDTIKQEIEVLCEAQGISKSEFFREAINKFLNLKPINYDTSRTKQKS
jgi:predicted DNA-binding protein